MMGDEIVITIVDIRGDKVRLGIEAPKHVKVHREEVYIAIGKQTKKAERIAQAEAETAPAVEPTPAKAGSVADFIKGRAS